MGRSFVAADDGEENFAFAWRASGSRTLQPVLLPQSIHYPGGIAWDGTYVAVGDQSGEAIYQFSFTKGRPQLQGKTRLNEAGNVGQFAIVGAPVVAPDQLSSTSNVLFYPYPAGGAPTQTITDGVSFPYAAVVSRV